MKWFVAALLAVVGCTAVGTGFAVLGRPTQRVPTAASLAPLFESERALAVGAGLAVVEASTVTAPLRRERPVAAGECVAVVATADGIETLAVARLTLASGEHVELAPYGPPTRAAHHALCARVETIATIELALTTGMAEWEAPSHLRFAILEGVVASPRLYTRLTVDEAARAAFDEAAVRARVAALVQGEPVGEAREVPRGTAVLLPASRATHAAARSALGAHRIPRLDARDAASDPFRTPDDVAVPARVHTSTGIQRLLAVADAGGLGAPCAQLTFARLAESTTQLRVTRVAIPSLEETVLAGTDPSIVTDAICPATGLFFYAVDEDAGGTYLVSASAQASLEGVVATPSTFEPQPLAMAEVVAARRGCESGATADCLRLASLAAADADDAGLPGPPLTRACDLGDGDGCDRLGRLLAASTDAAERARADELERRACGARFFPACLRRAARFREGARDLPAAHVTYRFACAMGDASACAAAQTMEEWELASAVGPAPTAEMLP